MNIRTTSIIMRAAVTLLLLATCTVLQARQNPKFAWTTQLFLEQQRQEQQVAGSDRAPERRVAPRRASQIIASPHTIDGTAYISCFVYLTDPTDLSALRALGVRVEKTFRGLSFITADVPVAQLEAVAELENVTCIKVSELVEPASVVAREKTNVTPLLTNTELSQQRGLNTTYDGSGVVLGVVDVGIDFGHIAFKNADGTSRIKRAYVYDGNQAQLYTEAEMNNPVLAPTTDDFNEDHGTYTSSIAGGSSVIVERLDNTHYNMSVTNAHDSATYGGMAPGADLYLAGVNGLEFSHLASAIAMIAEYADSVGKPLVINCSWTDKDGPRNGKGEVADVVHAYFGDNHPDRIILFSTANKAGIRDEHGGGGCFVNRKNASRENPLRTIVRTNGRGGDYYDPYSAVAWSDSALNCTVMVLDNDSGNILWSYTYTLPGWSYSDSLAGYNPQGLLGCYLDYDDTYEGNLFYLYTDQMVTTVPGAYSLAVEVYPESGTADVNMWGLGNTYFSNYLAHPGHDNPWQDGSDDNSIGHEASIDGIISVGAFVSKVEVTDYENNTYYTGDTPDDIAWFSSYATQECSVSGQTAPWITAPGMFVAGAGNHYSFQSAGSCYNQGWLLAVNDSVNPYFNMMGTSSSTPVASGIVALWLQAAQSVGKSLTINQVKDIMRQTAVHDYYTDDQSNAKRFGCGKIDALAGIKRITGNHSVLEIGYKRNNDSLIAQHFDSTTHVLLLKHTLYKDDGWNSLCLPFSLDSTELSSSELAGGTLVELDTAGFVLSDTTLTVTFRQVSNLEAGKPYLIKWPEAENLLNTMFYDATISNTTPIPVTSSDGRVAFRGTYNMVPVQVYDSTILPISWADTLKYSAKNTTIGSCCAYFELQNISPAPTRVVFNVNYHDIPTGLEDVRGQMAECPPDGTGGTASAEGGTKVLIDGLLYIRRGGVVYDALGRVVRERERER